MRRAVELPDVHNIVFIFQYGRLVVINVEVVRRREDGHDTWEPSRPSLTVHPVASILCLMRPDNGEQVVLLQEITGSRIREEIRAPAHMIVHEIFIGLLLAEILERVSP